MSLTRHMLNSGLLLIALLLTYSSFVADKLFELCKAMDVFVDDVSLLDLRHKDEQMTQQSRIALERMRSKDRIAESLILGDLPLAEAAALFRSLYDDSKSWCHPDRPRPGHEDSATWCREVMDWTVNKVRIERSPSQADALQQRLEEEFQEQVTKCERVQLHN